MSLNTWDLLLRVLDSDVAGNGESLDDGPLDGAEFLESEHAVVELAIFDLLCDEAVDELGDALLAHIFEGAGGCLDGIGHHDDGRLFRSGSGTGIAELFLIDGIGIPAHLLHLLAVEVIDEGVPMVFSNDIDEDLW